MATSTTTLEELAQRKGYFATTYAEIKLHNKRKSSFKMALNRFSAMVTIIFVCFLAILKQKHLLLLE